VVKIATFAKPETDRKEHYTNPTNNKKYKYFELRRDHEN